MDPDQALHNLREGLRKVRAAQDKDKAVDGTVALEDVLSAAEALDGWLAGGGFLPKLWQSGRRG
jgi:hypothetical protein